MRKNNIQDMTLTEQMEDIKAQVCDKVCRWRAQALEVNKDPDEAYDYLIENYCNSCPMERL